MLSRLCPRLWRYLGDNLCLMPLHWSFVGWWSARAPWTHVQGDWEAAASLLPCEVKATSSAKNSSRMSFSVPFVLVRRWAMLNSLPWVFGVYVDSFDAVLEGVWEEHGEEDPKKCGSEDTALLQSSTAREGVRRRATNMTFYWFTLFVDSFVNSGWLGLVVFLFWTASLYCQLFGQQRSTTRF